MPNDRRITFRFLGWLMEAVNVTPHEVRKTMWSAARIVFLAIVLWRLPELLGALHQWVR